VAVARSVISYQLFLIITAIAKFFYPLDKYSGGGVGLDHLKDGKR